MLYIFDAISCQKIAVTFDSLAELTGRSKAALYGYKRKKTYLRDIHGFLIDERTTQQERQDMMASRTLKDEVWVTLKDFPHYQISNYGRIKSKLTHRFIMPYASSRKLANGNPEYVRVKLTNEKSQVKECRLAQLMRDTFMVIPSDLSDPVCCHLDGNPWNNRLNNLKMMSRQELQRRQAKKRRKPVVQLCPVTERELNEYPSIKAAAEAFGLHSESIRYAAKNSHQTAAGYKWRFLNEDDEY